MPKHTVAIVAAVVLAVGLLTLGIAAKPSATSGAWQVDYYHSDAQLITDAKTDYGKTKINYTVGFARVSGALKLDDGDPANSKLDLHMYPAETLGPAIEESGQLRVPWMAELATHTLVCFHSKKIVRTSDGKLQATGDLVLTRVDRNVQLEPNEAYSGPVYGPPVIHRIVREATFVLDLTPAAGNAAKGGVVASGTTSVSREGFPQLVRAVVSTYWPPVVMDKNCRNPTGNTEDYRGFKCTGTFMQAGGLPPAPTQAGEDYPAPSNFNTVVGNQLEIKLHLHLTQGAAAAPTAGM